MKPALSLPARSPLPLCLPRLVFGEGCISRLGEELRLSGAHRPMLVTDRGLERAGVIRTVEEALPSWAATFLEVPENPTAAGADAALAVFRAGKCDAIVAVGGGSVLDTAKLVCALVHLDIPAADLIGKPDRIHSAVPLIAVPTTVGTGSESSPVAALHITADGVGIGTRSPLLVPKVALCDPALVRSLPPRLIAATAIDALSHCIEGYFAEPEHPVIDALALDGAARVMASVEEALLTEGDAARASLMAAAFAGGAAIHKGLGPAHAVALACGDQDIHHGTLVGVALPGTTALLASRLPAKAARLAAAMGLETADEIADRLSALMERLGLPMTLDDAGYVIRDRDKLVQDLVDSPFNRTSPYVPSREEYQAMLASLTDA